MSRRYVVIGAGGVGAAFAAGLQEAGIDVVLVSRGATYEAISRLGLRYTQGGRTRVLDVGVVDGPEGVHLRAEDVLVVATKAQDSPAALADWAWRPVPGTDLVGADLPVVTLSNGLVAEPEAARRFRTVVGGTTLIAAMHVEPGVVIVGNAPKAGQLIVGAYPSAVGDPEAARVAAEVAADAVAAGWVSQDVDDIGRWTAWKLAVNASNAVDVLSGPPERIRELAEGLTAEAEKVLAAAGLALADPTVERRYDTTLTGVSPESGIRRGQQSTWQSFTRGAGSEVDHLNGELVLLARRHGVQAPLNAAIQRVLGRSAARAEPPGTRNVEEVLAVAARIVKPGTAG